MQIITQNEKTKQKEYLKNLKNLAVATKSENKTNRDLICIFDELLSRRFHLRELCVHLTKVFFLVFDRRVRDLRRIQFLNLEVLLKNVHLYGKLCDVSEKNIYGIEIHAKLKLSYIL